ncbi:hypothetical protein CISG_08744 [Coccidioides immitis RMSCC 3703]|uniref:Uncharacterized protein n=1 Tax=Coccidioides immitis RMSCC 3703 TaxID=454286 RepID=A0A0J8R8C1_COCIT|nr:hypothetical protein CISG_08744 [Coccidioides immitis RMSCC 3703]
MSPLARSRFSGLRWNMDPDHHAAKPEGFNLVLPLPYRVGGILVAGRKLPHAFDALTENLYEANGFNSSHRCLGMGFKSALFIRRKRLYVQGIPDRNRPRKQANKQLPSTDNKHGRDPPALILYPSRSSGCERSHIQTDNHLTTFLSIYSLPPFFFTGQPPSFTLLDLA